MEMVKDFVVRIVFRVAVLSIAIFYSSLVTVGIVVKRFIKGKEYWYVKERTLPPLILQDVQWGRHSYINLQGIKLHYVENGDRDKPLILFLHGFPEFWFSWRHQLNHFAKDYWVVALDQRGYGESDKPSRVSSYKIETIAKDVYDFVKAVGKEKCILVGHDWGGAIAWSVASNYAEIVEKLVILNCPHPEAFRIKLASSLKQFVKSWYMFAFQLPYLPELYFRTQDLEVFRDFFENKLSEEELEAYKYNWSRPGAFTPPINWYRNAFEPSRVLTGKKYPIITIPTITIWGVNDIALTKDLPEMSKPYVKNMKVHYINNGNHFIQNDKPDEVNQVMEKFLKEKS